MYIGDELQKKLRDQHPVAIPEQTQKETSIATAPLSAKQQTLSTALNKKAARFGAAQKRQGREGN
jgi:hypothetical protein